MIALLLLIYTTRFIVMSALIGVGAGVLISPIMSVMKDRFHIHRGMSALLLLLLIFGGLVSLFYALSLLVSDQAQSLIDNAPELFSGAKRQIEQIFSRYPWILNQIQKLNLSVAAQTTVGALFKGLQTGAVAIGGSLIVLILALYVATNSRSYFKGFLSLFPGYQRPQVSEVLQRSARVLRQWFKSQLIVMAIVGSVTTLGLWAIGIDYWLLFGLMTGVLGIIPYVGVLITVTATCLATLGSEPDKVLWVIGLFLITQQLEGNILVPLVMKEGVQLPEAHLIFLMLILGSWFGILGVFVAPPLFAVVRSIYLTTYVPKMNEKIKPPIVPESPPRSSEDLKSA
jgi:predicted PurR-regulated permease PerM